MYIIFGNQIVDSSEIKDIIDSESEFIVDKDLSKGSKREDVVAFQVSIEINTLNTILKEDYEVEDMDTEELFDEYMTLTEEIGMQLEEYMPEDCLINVRSYKWDNSEDVIKAVVVVAHEDLGEIKLVDVTKRLISQVD